MADHPLLFSGPMIRAILREIDAPGTGKTQTRRVQAKDVLCAHRIINNGLQPVAAEYDRRWPVRTKYHVGDRLWCREAWRAARSYDRTPPRDIPRDADIEHAATARSYAKIWLKGKLRPGMFLPRWASRLTLYVTEVRVERLNSITEADAEAEGILHQNVILDVKCYGGQPVDITADRYWNGTEPDEFEGFESASDAYADLWDQINGPGAWDANPCVAAYTFRPVLGNIDALPDTLQEAV